MYNIHEMIILKVTDIAIGIQEKCREFLIKGNYESKIVSNL